MDVLLICGLVAVALIAIVFLVAFKKWKAVTCLVCFVLMFVIAIGALCILSQPPKTEAWKITYVEGNMLTMYSNGRSTSMDIAKIPHLSYDYKADTMVQVMYNALGAPIYLAPQDFTILPTN